MGWTNDTGDSITVPSTAGADDPRVFVGQGDPMMSFLGQEAGTVFYSGNERAVVNAIDALPFNTAQLQQTVMGPGGAILAQPWKLDIDYTTGEVNAAIGAGCEDVRLFPGGKSMPRGGVARSAPITVGPFPTAAAPNALLLTVPEAFYRAGRAFKVTVRGRLFAAAIPAGIVFRVRKGATAAGAVIVRTGAVDVTGTGADRYLHVSRIFTTGAADVTTELCLTGDPTTATPVELRGTDGDPLVMQITDIGAASDYPGYLALT